MGIVRRNVEIEEWIIPYSQNWQFLTDPDYHQLINRWKQHFWHCIETARRNPHGDKAKYKLQELLPFDCYVFSGIKVDVAANMGGKTPFGYFVEELSQINWDLCRSEETIIAAKDFSFMVVCSHEEGFETFYENR